MCCTDSTSAAFRSLGTQAVIDIKDSFSADLWASAECKARKLSFQNLWKATDPIPAITDLIEKHCSRCLWRLVTWIRTSQKVDSKSLLLGDCFRQHCLPFRYLHVSVFKILSLQGAPVLTSKLSEGNSTRLWNQLDLVAKPCNHNVMWCPVAQKIMFFPWDSASVKLWIISFQSATTVTLKYSCRSYIEDINPFYTWKVERLGFMHHSVVFHFSLSGTSKQASYAGSYSTQYRPKQASSCYTFFWG